METLTKISLVIFTVSLIGLLIAIIWVSIKIQQDKYEKKRKEFLDESTKLPHEGVEAFIKRLNP